MSHDERIAIALAALAEVTEPGAVGPLVDATVPVPGVIDLRFATTQRAYSGWFWTVSTSAVEDVEPTVLELQLLPGDGALVAPSWVPWEERLAEWRRTHADAADDGVDDLDDDAADDLDDDDLDDDALDGLDDTGALDADLVDEDDDEDDLDLVVDEVLDDGDVAGVDVDATDAAEPVEPPAPADAPEPVDPVAPVGPVAAAEPVDAAERAAPRRRRRRAQRP